jgi:hypothetical protein
VSGPLSGINIKYLREVHVRRGRYPHPKPSRSGLSLRIPPQARHASPSPSGDHLPGNSPQAIPPVCQVELDATDSTAQNMLQDSDSEGEQDDEDEDEGSWDLNDDGESCPHLLNRPI